MQNIMQNKEFHLPGLDGKGLAFAFGILTTGGISSSLIFLPNFADFISWSKVCNIYLYI